MGNFKQYVPLFFYSDSKRFGFEILSSVKLLFSRILGLNFQFSFNFD